MQDNIPSQIPESVWGVHAPAVQLMHKAAWYRLCLATMFLGNAVSKHDTVKTGAHMAPGVAFYFWFELWYEFRLCLGCAFALAVQARKNYTGTYKWDRAMTSDCVTKNTMRSIARSSVKPSCGILYFLPSARRISVCNMDFVLCLADAGAFTAIPCFYWLKTVWWIQQPNFSAVSFCRL